tara:strand:- start:9 stop:896 length:888 start_codon:yes stop_codon:yes gene_type:complete
MKILSWDVGIRNLAGCIINYNCLNISDPYSIEWWEIIDLLDEPEILCSHIDKKTNKPCTNKAKHSNIFFNNNYTYCGVHVKKFNSVANKLTFNPIKNDKKSCFFCENISKFSVTYNEEDIHLCTNHKNKCLKEMKLKNVKQPSLKNVDIDKLKYNLWVILDKLPHLLKVDHIIIENQPSLKNPKMKSISETLYNYFLCRGIIDKKITLSNITKIKYISPSNKLKINKDNTNLILSNSKSSSETYKLTKELAVKYCYQFIKNYPSWHVVLDKAKKKDDLCDCLLQGIYYLMVQHQL